MDAEGDVVVRDRSTIAHRARLHVHWCGYLKSIRALKINRVMAHHVKKVLRKEWKIDGVQLTADKGLRSAPQPSSLETPSSMESSECSGNSKRDVRGNGEGVMPCGDYYYYCQGRHFRGGDCAVWGRMLAS